MAAFNTISVRIVTSSGSRDGYGGSNRTETDVAGSPFQARLYRSTPGSGYMRNQAQTGTTTIEQRRVLSIGDVAAAAVIQEGMTVIIPPHAANGNKEERASVQRIRMYERSAQIDLHSGSGKE